YTNKTFYPFHYEGLDMTCSDVVIIEGYFAMIASFVNEVRRIDRLNKRSGRCPAGAAVKVIFWSLDPDFPTPDVLVTFDFDAILTNSREVEEIFKAQGVKTAYNELAVDSQVFRPLSRGGGKKTDIVFVGSGGAIVSGAKKFLKEALLAAIETSKSLPDTRVVIYGSSWSSFPEFVPYWEGVLPQSDLSKVYSDALVVLGSTMDTQREAGMVNNRVYEVLSTSTPLLTEKFDGVRAVCEGVCLYYEVGSVWGGVKKGIEDAYNMGEGERAERGAKGRDRVVEEHGYDGRLQKFVDVFWELEEGKEGEGGGRGHRKSMPKVLFITEVGWWRWGGWGALEAMKSDFDVEVQTIESIAASTASNKWLGYNFVIGIGSLGGPVDHLLRSEESRWPRAWTLKNLQPQYRGFVVVDEGGGLGVSGGAEGWGVEDWRCYDVIYVSADGVKGALEEARRLAGAGTHVVWQNGIGLKGDLARVGKKAIDAFIVEWRGRGVERVKIIDERNQVCGGGEEAGKATVVLASAGWDGARDSGVVVAEACDATVVIGPDEVWKLYLIVVSTYHVDITESLIQPSTVDTILALIADHSIVTREVKGLPGWSKGGGGGLRKDKFGLDESDRGEAIMYGMTRSMCLGRSAADLEVVYWGVEGGTAGEGSVIFTVDTPGWVTGRDGLWCLHLNGQLVTCIQQQELGLRVDFEGLGGRVETVKVELRGNVYDDVVRTWEGEGFEVTAEGREGGGLKGWGGRIVKREGGGILR
ncbi:hypothetical protein TrRE_jg2360, partial [Triparma retinervis]